MLSQNLIPCSLTFCSFNPYLLFKFLNFLIILKTAGALISLFVPCMECCGDASCLRIPIDREESNGRKHKGITMAQWKNSLRNNSFVNPTQ